MDRRLEATGCMMLVLAAALACGKGEKAGAGPGSAPGAAEPAEPVISVTAKDLSKDYSANEVAADEKYKDKRLDVTGRVQSIDKDVFDNMVVHLATDNQFMGVMATMTDDSKAAVAKLAKGQTAVLRCRGTGMVIGSPTLKDCTVGGVGK